jgi:hypothetical protein
MSFAPWIKIETTLPDKPEVIAMAAMLRVRDSDAIVGKLVRLWAWADQNSIDGHRIAITREFIDRLCTLRGFSAALQSVGWLVLDDGLLTFPHFARHNGHSAKSRASEVRKKQSQRGRDKRPAKSPPECPDAIGTNVPEQSGNNSGPEEEIEGEKGTTATAREAEALVAACPRPSPTQPALKEALACLKRHADTFTFQKILAATKEATRLIREWPENERIAYCPSAVTFFAEDRWRSHPDDFRSRRAARTGLANGKPALTDEERAARLGGRA